MPGRCLLLGAGLFGLTAVRGGNVIPTNTWVDFYGTNSTYLAAPVPVGATIAVFDPQGVRGRGGPDRPQCETVTVRYQIMAVSRQAEALAVQQAMLGWRAYVTNAPAAQRAATWSKSGCRPGSVRVPAAGVRSGHRCPDGLGRNDE